MKKNLIFIFAFAFLAFAVVSCGGNKETPKEEAAPSEEVKAQESQPEESQAPESPPAPEAPEPPPPPGADKSKIEAKAPAGEKHEVEKAKSAARNPKSPIMGRVVSLNKALTSADGAVTKAEAKKLLKSKQLIVFQEGSSAKGKIYFVYNADGSFAGKKLAKNADNKMIGIIGKIKKIKGVSVIIADKIMAAK